MNNVVNAMLLTRQLAILQEVAKDYSGKTIENIIQQMKARRNVAMGHDADVSLESNHHQQKSKTATTR